MIVLVALLAASQPMPTLDRSWINREARREMLLAASVDPLPVELLQPNRKPARARFLHGGPSGM